MDETSDSWSYVQSLSAVATLHQQEQDESQNCFNCNNKESKKTMEQSKNLLNLLQKFCDVPFMEESSDDDSSESEEEPNETVNIPLRPAQSHVVDAYRRQFFSPSRVWLGSAVRAATSNSSEQSRLPDVTQSPGIISPGNDSENKTNKFNSSNSTSCSTPNWFRRNFGCSPIFSRMTVRNPSSSIYGLLTGRIADVSNRHNVEGKDPSIEFHDKLQIVTRKNRLSTLIFNTGHDTYRQRVVLRLLISLEFQIAEKHLKCVSSRCTEPPACPVCLSNFTKGDSVLRLPYPCVCSRTILYHSECIGVWLCRHSSCPLCRHDVML